jgi:hypothetical protein
VSAGAKPSESRLEWQPPPIRREIRGYRLYRREATEETYREITDEPIDDTTFVDVGLSPGRAYSYFATSEEHSGLESDASSRCVRFVAGQRSGSARKAVAGWDRVAPQPPSGLRSEWVSNDRIRLSWTLSSSPDVRYYNIYYRRGSEPTISQAHRIVSPGKDARSYIDWGVGGSQQGHFYAITAVDRQGNESSPAFATATR